MLFSRILFFSLELFCFTLTVFSNGKVASFKLIVFEGSDWCASCRLLKKEYLNDPDFKTFMDENLIELEFIDFPQRLKLSKGEKEYNESVADKYNFQGIFPMLILVNLESKKSVTIVFSKKMNVTNFINQINNSRKKLTDNYTRQIKN